MPGHLKGGALKWFAELGVNLELAKEVCVIQYIIVTMNIVLWLFMLSIAFVFIFFSLPFSFIPFERATIVSVM